MRPHSTTARLLGKLLNGWQLTTYTTYQDGSPYRSNSPAMKMIYSREESR